MQAKQVLQYARQQWKDQTTQIDKSNDAVRMGFETLAKYAGKKISRTNEAFKTGDFTQLPRFDEVASQVANEHPGLFGGDERQNIEKLYELMKAGPQAKPSLQSFQQRSLDEFISSNPKLKADKPKFEPLKESPLDDAAQKALYDSLPRAALGGNTPKAHAVLDTFTKLKEGKASQEDTNRFLGTVKDLNRNELWVLKNGLKIGMAEWDKGSRVNQINTLLAKAGLGHHAIDQQPKDVPFSEPDDATQEAHNATYNRNLDWHGDVDDDIDEPFQAAIAAWLQIDGDADDLKKLIEVASSKTNNEEYDFPPQIVIPGKYAEPAERLVAPTGEGKKADDRQAVIDLMDKALAWGPKRMSGYLSKSLRIIGLDQALGSGVLFTPEYRQKLQDDFASVLATGDLLGRSRVRIRAEQAYRKHPTLFSEVQTDYSRFDELPRATMPEDLPLLTPQEAYDYFINLVPTLNVHPDRFGQEMERRAFTLAVATEKTLLEEIQKVIADSLGHGTPGGAVTIRQILIQTGNAPDNPQYAEAVYRTNVMDSCSIGHDREMANPSMQATFPAFLYSAITGDGRGRPWHVKKNGLLYPSKVGFVTVRGTEAEDVINCRCNPIAIDKFELADRLARGEEIQTRW